MNALFDDLTKKDGSSSIWTTSSLFPKDLKNTHFGQKGFYSGLEEEDLFFLKPEKCFFEKPSIEYIGMIISQNDPDGSAKLSTVLEWPTPKCVKDVQSFLRFGNFYRRFIQGLQISQHHSHHLTRKDITCIGMTINRRHSRRSKQRFTLAPILLMRTSQAILLRDRCSDYGNYGAILSQQLDDGHWLPVTYMSKQMLPAECNYVIYDKELLAIIEALKLWRHYLEGSPASVEIWFDHKNLEFFVSASPLIADKARWSLFLSRFSIHHFPTVAGTLKKADHLTQRLLRDGRSSLFSLLFFTFPFLLHLHSQGTVRYTLEYVGLTVD